MDPETPDQSSPAPKPLSPLNAKGKPRKKPGRPKGVGNLTEKDHEARQALMLAQKISGKYTSQIAAAFQVSETTVNTELREAQRKQLHGKAVAFISHTLMPKALAVMAAALDRGDKDIAVKVLEGLGILGRGNQPGLLQINLGGEDVSAETFEAYRIKLIRKAGHDLPPTASEVVEGRVVGGSDQGPGAGGPAQEGQASDSPRDSEGSMEG